MQVYLDVCVCVVWEVDQCIVANDTRKRSLYGMCCCWNSLVVVGCGFVVEQDPDGLFYVRRSIKTPALVLKNEISWNCSRLRDTVDSFVTCHFFKCEARSRPVNNQPELTIYIFGTSNNTHNAPNRVQDDWRREVLLLLFFVRWKIVATTHYYHHHQVDSYR